MRRVAHDALRLSIWVATVLVVGCKAESGAAPATRMPADPQVVVGSLEGFVRLTGDKIPPPTRVQNTTDPTICGSTKTLEDLLVSVRGRGIRNVIVALTDVPEERIPPPLPEQLVLDNRQCQFVPHVSVLTVGSTIEAVNSDRTLHTTHLYGAVGANLALPFSGTRATIVVDEPGMVMVRCDVHGWMQAFIRVDPHPFHAVSDATGSFRIEKIPAGTYQLEAWHERLGSQEKTVRIEAGERIRIPIEYALPE